MTRQQDDTSVPAEILDRLKRIEGQVRGLQRMVKQGRSPSEVIYQMAAVKCALEQAALHYLRWEAQRDDGSEEVSRSIHATLDLVAKML
ncbi:MAG: metal-sensitive transcriptional regulator [Armatimonadota bacterium]|nr:metal-sensitive transcriptional regulator [Armatimonadota bacterium]MDW8290209.1 metal-sensitive transcriptional regulator [Armatimonadota bacterium]